VLLSSAESKSKDAGKSERMLNYLNHEFVDQKHLIELQYLNLKDIIDLEEIIPKVQEVLLEHKEVAVDVFVSPGTPMMQVAWMLLYMSHVIPHLRLIQGVEGAKTSTGRPEFRVIHFEQSETLRALFVKSGEMELPYVGEQTFWLSPVLKPVYQQAQLVASVAKREITVLIQGESGTGKENLAQFLHAQSTRKGKSFKAINCAAISPTLLESRLFGSKKGAYTGANQDQMGLFESCEGGTLFLDEIGDIGPEFQQSLLRVLQEGTIYPVGSTEPRQVDVKVITATHQDLRRLCQEGKFRWDLFYRLTTVVLKLPPLREYPPTEQEALLHHLLATRAAFFERKMLTISPSVRQQLRSYAFPGNIRELIHLIDRWYIFCTGEVREEDIPVELLQRGGEHSWSLHEVERKHIEKALKHFNYNLTQTSSQLGIAKNTLKARIREFGIPFSTTDESDFPS